MASLEAVVGDVLLVGDQFGNVYAIETASGCVRWTFEADAGVRGAILVGDVTRRPPGSHRLGVIRADQAQARL